MDYYNQKHHKAQGVRLKVRKQYLGTQRELKAELRQGLLDLCIQSGFTTLAEMLEDEVTALCGGEWYVHGYGRGAYRWGKANGQVVLGGRKLSVVRQRLRDLAGHEVMPAVYRQFRDEDRLSARVLRQLLAGVSMRRYQDALETGDSELDLASAFRGGSRSAVSRCFVARTGRVIKAWLSRSLDKIPFVALFIDGIRFGDHTLVAALGVVADGTKQVLGVWEGSTENKVICQALLDNLVRRGFCTEEPILVVMDGSKALHSAVVQTFGANVLIQRCQYHKRQNVKGHLPKQMQSLVDRTMIEAYHCEDASRARLILQRLYGSLKDAYPGAARSLEEGLDETLTVLDLGLPESLRQSLQTTNLIESAISVMRQVSKHVKRWRNGGMAERWAALGLMEAEKRFRKIKGYRDLPVLVEALKKTKALDKQVVA